VHRFPPPFLNNPSSNLRAPGEIVLFTLLAEGGLLLFHGWFLRFARFQPAFFGFALAVFPGLRPIPNLFLGLGDNPPQRIWILSWFFSLVFLCRLCLFEKLLCSGQLSVPASADVVPFSTHCLFCGCPRIFYFIRPQVSPPFFIVESLKALGITYS